MKTSPLTPEQQSWLKANALLPVVFLVIILAVFGGIFACLFSGLNGKLFFTAFFAIAGFMIFAVLIAAGIHVYNNFMDLRDGVTQVHEAELMRKHHTYRSPKMFYAEFEGVCSVIVMGDVYEKLEEGKTYRVIYSPRTRRGWDVDLRS